MQNMALYIYNSSIYRVSKKKTDTFHIQISRELIAGILQFPLLERLLGISTQTGN